MDDNIRKSWRLQPSLVKFENPLWQNRIDELTKIIAGRLGYIDIPLRCALYKLLMYGEGGHLVKHQDTEKEGCVIATLVIQPPSSRDGGNLVCTEVEYRHVFGKADATSAFLPHYAVHYADAEHALETATKGHRLVLVYSICLPPMALHLERHVDSRLSEDLTGAFNKMGKEDNSFVLLLEHEYMENAIQCFGSKAFKGGDRAKSYALEGANSLVAADKKLHFFIARLMHDYSYGGNLDEHTESISWYSMDGDDLGHVPKSTVKFNLLNPNNDNLYEIWMPHYTKTKEGGYMGNEEATSVLIYSRVAIVAWLASRQIENALKFMPVDAAVDILHTQKPVIGPKLRKFLDAVSKKLTCKAEKSSKNQRKKKKGAAVVSMKFCRLFCDLLLEAGDAEVRKLFFKKFCGKLGNVEGNETLIPSITQIVRRFGWKVVRKAVLPCLGEDRVSKNSEEKDNSAMEMTLQILDGLDGGAAQQDLLKVVVKMTKKMDDNGVFSMRYVGLPWKWIIRSDDTTVFEVIAKRFTNVDASKLGPCIQYLSQNLIGIDVNDEKVTMLAAAVTKRTKWLKSQLENIDKKFSWDMPNAEFPDSEPIQIFLRSPGVSVTTQETHTI